MDTTCKSSDSERLLHRGLEKHADRAFNNKYNPYLCIHGEFRELGRSKHSITALPSSPFNAWTFSFLAVSRDPNLSSCFLALCGPACAKFNFTFDPSRRPRFHPDVHHSFRVSVRMGAAYPDKVSVWQQVSPSGCHWSGLRRTSVSCRVLALKFAKFCNGSRASPVNGVQHPIVSRALPGRAVTPPQYTVTSIGAAPVEVPRKK